MNTTNEIILTEQEKKLYVFITRIALPMFLGIIILGVLHWGFGPMYHIEKLLLKQIIGIGLLVLAIILLTQCYWYYHFPPGKGEIITVPTGKRPTEENYGMIMEKKSHTYHRIYVKKMPTLGWTAYIEIYE